MGCLSPLTVKKKDGSYVQVPCRRCIPCRKKRVAELSYLSALERLDCYKRGQGSSFLTLTYAPASLPISNHNPTLRYDDLRHFFMRFRFNLSKVYKGKFKYLSCGEYGDTDGLPHYHIVFFGLDDKLCDSIASKSWIDKKDHLIGLIDTGPLVTGGVSYVTKYVMSQVYGDMAKKLYDDLGIERPFFHRSQGIGIPFIKRNIEKIAESNYCDYLYGRPLPLSNYLRTYYHLDDFKSFDPTPFMRFFKNQADKAGLTIEDYCTTQGLITTKNFILSTRSDGCPIDDTDFKMFQKMYRPRCNSPVKKYIKELSND